MSNRTKTDKTVSESMFSTENILETITDAVAPKTRDSQRNKDRGIQKRGVAPHTSQRDQPGPSTQVGPLRKLNDDPTTDREAGMGRNTHMESDNNNAVANAESKTTGDAREEKQPQAEAEIPASQLEQSEELRQMQVPSHDKSIEEMERELERELEEWQANVRRANLRRKIQEEKEKFLAIENLSVSQKTNHDLSAQEKHDAYLSPTTNQTPRVSNTQNPSVDPITNRPSSSFDRPPVEQGESSAKESFEQHVRSPIYDCQPQPEDSRYTVTAGICGSTPRSTTSHLYKLMKKKGDLVSQIGNLKRDSEQLEIKLKHFVRIANDYDIRSDQDLYRLLETLVTWKERETYYHKYTSENRNYDTLKEFLMSGQARVSNVLLARPDKHSMSSRELGDEINHWLAEFRKEGVLTKFLTIHLAPPQLKKRLREKLHLKDKDFQIAWKVMLDTNEQEAKGRARNINYSNTPRSSQNKQTQAQQQGRESTNETIICRNHRRYGAKAYTCADKKCSMRHQTSSPPHAKNELPNSSQ